LDPDPTSAVYDNLFNSIKFSDEYSGFQFKGAWTEANAGGTPLKNTEEANRMWAENPQYLVELATDAHVFISLGQPDQRLIPGEVYPFSKPSHHHKLSADPYNRGTEEVDGLRLEAQGR